MQTNTLIETLIDFGLSEKEAKVYVSLLELEIATVGEIAKKSDINRSSVYVVLELLKKRGFVTTSGDKTVLHYIAVSPEVILKNAEDLAVKQNEIRRKIDDIIPELNALHKDTKIKPKIRVFEGKQGLINAFEDSLKCKEKLMRVSSSIENVFKIVPEYFPGYMERRKKLGIKMIGIHPNDAISQQLIKAEPINIDTSILIPRDKYNFSADLAIYDNKIAYTSAEKGGIAVIIEIKEMSDVMKSIFDMAFEEAKRLNKKIKK
jgi:sugar-specific transcriptional regulator TrmB